MGASKAAGHRERGCHLAAAGALAVASTVAPKAMATCSEGVNPRQERVTRDPASPALGERTQVGLAWLATVKVADAVLPL